MYIYIYTGVTIPVVGIVNSEKVRRLCCEFQ